MAMGDLIDELRRVDFEKPIVFISYTGEELALADFIRDIIHRLTESKIEAFVAKRDIPPGENPLKIMMEEKLKHAKAIIPICSVKSKTSSWVWWESAAVWAKDKKVYPLFTNISASDFGAPLTLVSQGKEYFSRQEFVETLKMVCGDMGFPIADRDLTKDEWDAHEKLKSEYSKPETSTKITADFKKLEMTQDLHKYSFVFEIENRSSRKFEDVDVDLYFPKAYLEKTEWNYPHLRGTDSRDKPGYLCLIFSFSGLADIAKKQFTSDLLPGKKLKLFGEDGMTKLHYFMDHDRWDKRFQYDIQWKVYINGGAPQEGSRPLISVQCF
ncbi:MAG: toll/interleukin-1 receptor domain-containing protein [Candidatus Omnitrophota bacterium]